MASITGSPVSQPEPPTLPFSFSLTMNSASGIAVAAVHGHHELHVTLAGVPRRDGVVLGRALGRRSPDLDEVDARSCEDRLRSIDPRLDVARTGRSDDPGDEVTLAQVRHTVSQDRRRYRGAGRQVRLADVGHPVVDEAG